MAKEEKAKIHRWVKLGVDVMRSANTFAAGFVEYARRVNDPSLLAMTKDEARHLLDDYPWPSDIERMLEERIRISELQGGYSLQRKRELREQRAAT